MMKSLFAERNSFKAIYSILLGGCTQTRPLASAGNRFYRFSNKRSSIHIRDSAFEIIYLLILAAGIFPTLIKRLTVHTRPRLIVFSTLLLYT